MKKVVTLFAMLAAALVFAPQVVEARHGSSRSSVYTYVSGRTSCGCPIYTKRVFCHYDRYGRPVYDYFKQPVTHRCSHYRSHRGHQHHAHRPVYQNRPTQYNYRGVNSYTTRRVSSGYTPRRSYSRSSCGY